MKSLQLILIQNLWRYGQCGVVPSPKCRSGGHISLRLYSMTYSIEKIKLKRENDIINTGFKRCNLNKEAIIA